MIGIDLQFFLEFLLGTLRIRRRLSQEDAPQPIVNAALSGILVEYPSILGGRLVPVPLGLESLGLKLLRLRRSGGRRRQLLRCTRGQLGVEVCCREKNLRIIGKIPIEFEQRLHCSVGPTQTHGASCGGHLHVILELLFRDLCGDLRQKRQGFLTSSLHRQTDATFYIRRSVGCGGLRRFLSTGPPTHKTEETENEGANKEQFRHGKSLTYYRTSAQYI